MLRARQLRPAPHFAWHQHTTDYHFIHTFVITLMLYSQPLREARRVVSDHIPSNPARPWRLIAEQASHELDPRKMVTLLRELNQALEEQEQGLFKSAAPREEKKSA